MTHIRKPGIVTQNPDWTDPVAGSLNYTGQIPLVRDLPEPTEQFFL